MDLFQKLSGLYGQLYPGMSLEPLQEFVNEVEAARDTFPFGPHPAGWYKDAVVYSLYVDLFNKDFEGLTEKLDYLEDLGVNCLWLLPILDSPMKDAGFDIRDYRKIRDELLGQSVKEQPAGDKQEVFDTFLGKAHERGIRVIFDIAINHTSDEHYWFGESRKQGNNPYRDYYIWSKDTNLYKEARIIFEGLCESNWQKDGDRYYFHRFFEFQPDLNYKNPQVLFEMSRNFIFWLSKGVDGFRADAIPYLWKEDGTNCENLPQTHLVVKFFRAVIEYLRPGTLLLAEACQKPKEVVKYFGNGDECNAGYHFPLMPQIFKSIALHIAKPVKNTLSEEVTPPIPEQAQWFTFLRLHDELSLEPVYVTEEDRKLIYNNYCLKPEWDFRLGQGISARLSELMGRDPQKTTLAYSVMLTLPGTPVVYYGDEFGKFNDEEYYKRMIKHTGKNDTRFLVRGEIDWDSLSNDLSNPNSFSAKVYNKIKTMINTRNKFPAFGRGSLSWLEPKRTSGELIKEVLAFKRVFKDETIIVLNNLSGEEISFYNDIFPSGTGRDLLGNMINKDNKGNVILQAYEYLWINMTGV